MDTVHACGQLTCAHAPHHWGGDQTPPSIGSIVQPPMIFLLPAAWVWFGLVWRCCDTSGARGWPGFSGEGRGSIGGLRGSRVHPNPPWNGLNVSGSTTHRVLHLKPVRLEAGGCSPGLHGRSTAPQQAVMIGRERRFARRPLSHRIAPPMRLESYSSYPKVPLLIYCCITATGPFDFCSCVTTVGVNCRAVQMNLRFVTLCLLARMYGDVSLVKTLDSFG